MYPDDYLYTKQHEWLRVEDDEAVIGITHHAQDQLGDIVYVEFPDEGTILSAGDEFGTVGSVKAVAEIFMPITGEVVAVNEDLEDQPELVNESPHETGWLVRIKVTDPQDLEELMDVETYVKFTEEESK